MCGGNIERPSGTQALCGMLPQGYPFAFAQVPPWAILVFSLWENADAHIAGYGGVGPVAIRRCISPLVLSALLAREKTLLTR
jgi:hypothetical protein